MPHYRYKAVTAADDTQEGEMEASSQAAVIDRLTKLGQTPVRVDEVSAGAGAGWLTRDIFGGQRVSRKDVTLMARELATLLHAGLPLDQAFEVLITIADREPVRALMTRVRNAVRGGASFGEALQAEERSFPTYFISMVHAGQAGGSLESVLSRLADFMERAQALTARVRTAMIYPAILLVMAGVSLALLITFVIPEFKPLFEDAGEALPWATRAILAASEGFERYGWALPLALVGAYAGFRLWRANADRRRAWDGRVLRVPLYGDLVTKIEVARFTRLLGTLLRNGVPMLRALSLSRDSFGNTALSAAVDDVALRAKEGEGLARPLGQTAVFPSLAVNLVRVGEESGELEDMLDRIADIYDREVQRALDRLMSLLVPALTITLGLLIGGIVASVLFAILSVNRLAF